MCTLAKQPWGLHFPHVLQVLDWNFLSLLCKNYKILIFEFSMTTKEDAIFQLWDSKLHVQTLRCPSPWFTITIITMTIHTIIYSSILLPLTTVQRGRYHNYSHLMRRNLRTCEAMCQTALKRQCQRFNVWFQGPGSKPLLFGKEWTNIPFSS